MSWNILMRKKFWTLHATSYRLTKPGIKLASHFTEEAISSPSNTKTGIVPANVNSCSLSVKKYLSKSKCGRQRLWNSLTGPVLFEPAMQISIAVIKISVRLDMTLDLLQFKYSLQWSNSFAKFHDESSACLVTFFRQNSSLLGGIISK